MVKKFKYVIFAIKCLVFAACLWYLGRIAVKIDPGRLSLSHVFPVCLCGFLYFACTFIIAGNWKNILFVLEDVKRKHSIITKVYFQTAIAKYIPSNVMHYAGRHYLGKQLGIEHKVIATSNLLEVCIIIVSAALIICASALFGILNIGQKFYKVGYNIWVIILAVVVTVIVCGVVRAKVQKDSATANSSSLIHFTVIIIHYIFFLVSAGVVLFLIFWMIGYVNFQLITGFEFIAIYTCSWVLGFITPGAPGGIGVRESVMVMLLSDKIGAENALMGALLFRLATVLGELIGFGYANWFVRGIDHNQQVAPAAEQTHS